MDELRNWLNDAKSALETLERAETLEFPPDVKRDVMIMRFIYTFEALWKSLQRYLSDIEGIDVRSPKGCLRRARDLGLLSDEQAESALAMVDDRNLTVHTYNETQAQQIFSRLPAHIAIMRSLFDALAERAKEH